MTRRAMIALGSILALALGLWYGPLLYRGAEAGTLPDLLSFVPTDSASIVYGDLAALRNTPWIDQMVTAAPASSVDPDYADFVRRTGFAFERDLDRFVVVQRPESTQTLVFAEGRFDRDKIANYAQRSGKTQQRDGRTVYLVPSVKSGKTISFTFLGNNRIAISDGGDIVAALASRSPNSSDSFAPAMVERLSRVSGSPVFAVTNMAQSGAANAVPSGPAAAIAAPFRAIRWISFAAQPDANQLLLSVEGECDRPDQAQQVAATMEFLRTMGGALLSDPKARGQMPADTAAQLSQFLQGARITTDGEHVRVLLSVTRQSINSIVQGTPKSAPR